MSFWKRGSRHTVERTRKTHKCERCGQIIPVGSKASFRNAFTGKRCYAHYWNCPPTLGTVAMETKEGTTCN